MMIGLPELRIWVPDAISDSKYCGYVLCGRAEGAGAFPRRYVLGPLGRAALYALTSCRSFSYTACVCYKWTWASFIWVQTGTYKGIFGNDASRGIFPTNL